MPTWLELSFTLKGGRYTSSSAQFGHLPAWCDSHACSMLPGFSALKTLPHAHTPQKPQNKMTPTLTATRDGPSDIHASTFTSKQFHISYSLSLFVPSPASLEVNLQDGSIHAEWGVCLLREDLQKTDKVQLTVFWGHIYYNSHG